MYCCLKTTFPVCPSLCPSYHRHPVPLPREHLHRPWRVRDHPLRRDPHRHQLLQDLPCPQGIFLLKLDKT